MVRDDTEFTAIFQEQQPGLVRFLECLLGQVDLAQEIAQETFLRFYTKGRVERVEQTRYWLFRVARNLALNELDRGRTRTRLRHVAGLALVPEASAPPDSRYEQEQLFQRVLSHLGELPEAQRSALLLREQEEMSYEEIACVLGVSLSKVRSDIFRARQRLREALGRNIQTEAHQ